MRVRRVELYSPVIGAAGSVLCYGEWGRPVLAFPSEQGRAEDFANNGMVATAEGLIAAGRVKIYCVDSYDSVSWAARDVPLEERARRHGAYESWIADQVAPFIHEDCGGRENTGDIVTSGARWERFTR